MNDKLKEFVDANKQEFYSEEPGTDLWNKIDARLEAEKPSRISSNWLSKFKYLGFSLSVLVVAVYFITKNVSGSPASVASQTVKKQSANPPAQQSPVHNNISTPDSNENKSVKVIHVAKEKSEPETKSTLQISSVNIHREKQPSYILNKDSVSIPSTENNASAEPKKINPENIPFSSKETEGQKKEGASTKNKKKKDITLPKEPETINEYSGTLYENSSICSVLRAYKFPGAVSMDVGSDHDTKVLGTTSCSLFETMPEIKAVWVKGKTDKEINIPVKKKFRNILLVKSDGRQLTPEAISHYYKGLGVISEYKGKHFEIIFKDKVDLLLFFKGAQEGDKIIIDGVLEAVIKSNP